MQKYKEINANTIVSKITDTKKKFGLSAVAQIIEREN